MKDETTVHMGLAEDGARGMYVIHNITDDDGGEKQEVNPIVEFAPGVSHCGSHGTLLQYEHVTLFTTRRPEHCCVRCLTDRISSLVTQVGAPKV